MKNDKLREFLEENFPDAIIFDDPEYDNSIVGISSEGNLIYDLNKMVIELAEDDNMSTDDAFEFIQYNTIRMIPYLPDQYKPMIVDFDFQELYND